MDFIPFKSPGFSAGAFSFYPVISPLPRKAALCGDLFYRYLFCARRQAANRAAAAGERVSLSVFAAKKKRKAAASSGLPFFVLPCCKHRWH